VNLPPYQTVGISSPQVPSVPRCQNPRRSPETDPIQSSLAKFSHSRSTWNEIWWDIWQLRDFFLGSQFGMFAGWWCYFTFDSYFIIFIIISWGGTDYKRAARWRHSRLVGSQTQQQFATRAPLAKDMRGLESFIEPIKIIEALVEFTEVSKLSLLPLLSGGGCMEAGKIRDE